MKKVVVILGIFVAVLWLVFMSLWEERDLDNSLVIYTSRKSELIEPVIKAFTQDTGIKVSYRTDKATALLERLKVEGDRSPADLLMTVDAGNLVRAGAMGVLEQLSEASVWGLVSKIESHLRDPKNRWFALSVRARPLFYNPKKVKPSELVGYEDLANPNWKGRLCLRTSKKVYTQSLVAALYYHHGEKITLQILKGWVKNLAAPVFHSDTKILQAIDSGQCDVGVANSYYFGRLEKKKNSLNVRLFWPNQKSTGVHINISGVGVVKSSLKKDLSLKFLNWIIQDTAQRIFANVNMEYPVVSGVTLDPVVESWGESFKQDRVSLFKIGSLQSKALKLMDRAGYE